MDMITGLLKVVGSIVIAFGTLMGAWGAITLGTGLKDHASPQITQGIGTLLGGALIIYAGKQIMGISLGI